MKTNIIAVLLALTVTSAFAEESASICAQIDDGNDRTSQEAGTESTREAKGSGAVGE